LQIADALHVCNSSSKFCPEPHCDGPLKPPHCHKSGGGSSSGGSSSSSSSSASSRSDSGGGSYVDTDGAEDRSYAEGEESEGDTEYSEARVDNPSSNSEGDSEVTSRFGWLWAVAAMAAVGSVIGAFLMKKNVSEPAGCGSCWILETFSHFTAKTDFRAKIPRLTSLIINSPKAWPSV